MISYLTPDFGLNTCCMKAAVLITLWFVACGAESIVKAAAVEHVPHQQLTHLVNQVVFSAKTMRRPMAAASSISCSMNIFDVTAYH